jgi:hypothetical protein
MPIPIKADEETRERYVQNIMKAYRLATPAQKIKGQEWYPVAHDLAATLADGDVRTGAGVLAALSANKSWRENQRLARKALTTGEAYGHVGNILEKVRRIMEGEDPENVLPMEVKTGHFYRCIVDPADPDPVVIDRHAHDVAVGEIYGNRERGLSSKGRYALLAHCYREAALRLGIIPSELQAVTWVRQTQMIAGRGFRTSEHAPE